MTRRSVQYLFEVAATRLILAFFAAMSVDTASAFGGWLGRKIGPLLAAHRTAARNLSRAMPNMDEAERDQTLVAMWDNLGRVAAEYAHLETLLADQTRIDVVDEDNVTGRLKNDEIGAILISAHFGNWELCPVPGYRAGLDQANFYRHLNNPYTDRLFLRLRRPLAPGGFLKKQVGGRKAVGMLKKGHHIAMLVDQKENNGIPVEFFGRPAMTTPGPALLARAAKVPIAADKVERLDGARFRITIHQIESALSGDRDADIAETTRRINALFEEWIRARPDLWLWPHHRWPDSKT